MFYNYLIFSMVALFCAPFEILSFAYKKMDLLP